MKVELKQREMQTPKQDGSGEVGVEVCVKVVLRKVRSKNKLEAWCCARTITGVVQELQAPVLLEKQAVLLETVLLEEKRSCKH